MKFVFLLIGIAVAYMAAEGNVRVRRQDLSPTITPQTATNPPPTVPAPTVPAPTVPATTVPATTVSAITVPATTVPATTVPPTTVPPTTVPPTTVPPTTVPPTVPATTSKAQTTVVTTIPPTTTTANPDEYSVQARASDGNCTCNVRGPNITEESICYIERDFQGLLDLEARILSIVAKAEGLTASTVGNEMISLDALIEHLELNYLSQSMNINYEKLEEIQSTLAEITLIVNDLDVNKTTEALVNQMTADMWTASAQVDERLEVNSVYIRKDLISQVADLETKSAGCAIGGESIDKVGASYFPGDTRPIGDIDTGFCERNRFTGVGWPMTHTSESGIGWWMKDPIPDSEENRTSIYYVAGHSGGLYMYKWNSYRDMWSRASKTSLGRTAKHMYGTNNALYNGSLYYYSSAKTLERVDYRTWSAKASLSIPEVETVPNFNRGGYTFVNIAVDEYGLYIAYVQKGSSYIQIKQLNPIDLTEIRHWGTHVAKSSISNLFFVCGVMYTMDSWNTPTPGGSQYAFDTRANGGRGASFTTNIAIPAMYKDMVEISYEMTNRMLFAYDASHLMTFNLIFEPKATPSTTTPAP